MVLGRRSQISQDQDRGPRHRMHRDGIPGNIHAQQPRRGPSNGHRCRSPRVFERILPRRRIVRHHQNPARGRSAVHSPGQLRCDSQCCLPNRSQWTRHQPLSRQHTPLIIASPQGIQEMSCRERGWRRERKEIRRHRHGIKPRQLRFPRLPSLSMHPPRASPRSEKDQPAQQA